MTQKLMLGAYDLSGNIYGSIAHTGGYWDIKQDGATSLFTGARKDSPKGLSISFSVCFPSDADASEFLSYIAPYSPDDPDFNESDGADIPLYIRSENWYYRVWGIVVKPEPLNKEPMDYIQFLFTITCYLYSPYSEGAAQSWTATGQELPQTKSLDNSSGHKASSFKSLEVTCAYNAGHVADLALDFGGDSLTLCDDALTNEVWELLGNENRLLQTYEDAITSGTQWGHDWTGSGTYDSGAIKLNNGESAYIKLSGPNPARKPVIMTADLSLDSGGATDEATVEISADGASWEEVLNQDDFESGVAEYVLSGTEYMTDIYIRLVCTSGTSGKYLRVGSIKFEVERWIASGAPVVPMGANPATATLSGTGTITIDGEFRPRRLFV